MKRRGSYLDPSTPGNFNEVQIPENSSFISVNGPFTGPFIAEGTAPASDPNRSIAYLLGAGGSVVSLHQLSNLSLGTRFVSVDLTEVVRVPAAPDACPPASLAPYYPLPLPDPGPGPHPPRSPTPDGGPVRVPFQPSFGPTFDIPITIGPIEVPISFNFPITINIDGRDYSLDADGDLSPRRDGDGGLTPEQESQLEKAFKDSDRELLEGVYEELFDERLIQLTTGPCGEEADSVVVLGNGIGLLASAFTQESLARYSQTQGLCPPDRPSNVSESLLFSGVAGEFGRTFYSSEFGPEVRAVRLEITGYDAAVVPDSSPFSGSGNRKYGNISCTMDGVDGPGEYVFIQAEEQYLPLPNRSRDARIRVQVRPSVSFSVYDTGERY